MKFFKKSHLQTQLIITASAVVILFGAVTIFVSNNRIYDQFYSEQIGSAQRDLANFVDLNFINIKNYDHHEIYRNLFSYRFHNAGIYVVITDSADQWIAERWLARADEVKEFINVSIDNTSALNKNDFLWLTQEFSDELSGELGTIKLLVNSSEITNYVRTNSIFHIIIWLVALVIILILLSYLSSKIMSPLRVVTKHFTKGEGSFSKITLNNSSSKDVEHLILNFNNMISQLDDYHKKIEAHAADAAFGKIAHQVAHDIRSPLAALEIASAHTAELPEEKRILIRNAVSRIRDIANNLVARGRQKAGIVVEASDKGEKTETSLLSSLVEELVTEKRLQYRSMMGIEIEAKSGEESYGLFAKIQPIEFKRVLSNLVNNAVEAMEGKGAVALSLRGDENRVLIIVTDNGKGILPEILPKLMQRGKTFGKEGGSGLGLAHAKEMVESWGGTVEIASQVGKGTTLKLILPRERAPDWFVPKLEIEAGTTMVILDDDLSIHQVWDNRFKECDIEVIHFSTADELKMWHENNKNKNVRYLCDYELLGQNKTGLDIIRDLGIQQSSILVTSRYEERDVLEHCFKLGVKLIPKSMAGFVPIVGLPMMETAICHREPEGRGDPVDCFVAYAPRNDVQGTNGHGFSVLVIDDDPLIGLSWRSQQETLKIQKLHIYSNMEACTSNGVVYSHIDIAFIDKNIPETTWELSKTIAYLKEKGVKKVIISSGEYVEDLRHDPLCQFADGISQEKIPKTLKFFM